jgi:hypothetical protein
MDNDTWQQHNAVNHRGQMLFLGDQPAHAKQMPLYPTPYSEEHEQRQSARNPGQNQVKIRHSGNL